MKKPLLLLFLIYFSASSFSQEGSLRKFLTDTSLVHASVSMCIADAENGEIIMEFNPEKSLTPASVMKLITTASALELLGPQYTFKTKIGYTGTLNKRSGKLTGNILIKGGGDPALGSKYFSDHYDDFINKWIIEIKKLGIKKIEGGVITDDSYYDFQPVPGKWLWEDTGNYYGAGAYGLSVFDNTYEIHFKTSSDSDKFIITKIIPVECSPELSNWLSVSGTSDEGYVFAAPYSTNGWLAGTIPANREDFVLKASISDPPLLIAKMINNKLKTEGIAISEEPSTFRSNQKYFSEYFYQVAETTSPPLADIIEFLNHESVNLFAEHLVKELGKVYNDNGSTYSGIEVIKNFLQEADISSEGMFLEDGSGLSPLNAINARELVNLLFYMRTEGKYFQEFYSSLPDAGKEGTLKYYFKDPVFDTNLRAKSGSMTRVRCYAGYFTTLSGKELIFSIFVNNYTGPSKDIISGIEGIFKEIILYK